MSANARVHLRIQGRVQGVYYRASCRQQAQALGLCGWVRNRWDGSVEAVAEGPQASLDAFVAWCRQGPPSARVDDLDAAWSDAVGGMQGFEQRPSL